MPAGRPSSYKPEYALQAEKLTKLGATDDQLADFFGVSQQTVNAWKNVYPEFLEALKLGKDEADKRVEQSLYKRALGYEQDAVKIFMPAGASEPIYAPYREKVQPDTTAAIFWLKNRKKSDWRDRQEVEHSLDESLANRLAQAKNRV